MKIFLYTLVSFVKKRTKNIKKPAKLLLREAYIIEDEFTP